MSFIKRVVNKLQNDDTCEIGSEFETANLSDEDCGGCPSKYPSSLKIDEDSKLLNSAPKPALQILVATGEKDWLRDISDEKTSWGRVCNALSKSSDALQTAAGGPVRVNGTDLEFDSDDGHVVSIILLPQFVRIETTAKTVVDEVLQVLTAGKRKDLPNNALVLKDKGYVMICSHGKRDKRCSVTAPILRKELEIELRHEGLYRDPYDDEPAGIRVVYCNHVGGHKFAANCFVYLEDGTVVLMARVKPEHAKSIVQKTILRGVVFPEITRNCAKLKSCEW
ncbi:Actin patches distal protein 1 [Wickerhamiella sorbophila]|uniref:Actin patches distal protein 1 n=1 Tax=Wickerhamiella sorbophila TaxID=45607 RepID=A0A2T0FEP3_9ASCO|nr:Actin patches distal protein 1 [Wickerhamiella sorbophila]PRT53429.1 Actin patches distal protein 1 [Wickerhamiella sorbophila]